MWRLERMFPTCGGDPSALPRFLASGGVRWGTAFLRKASPKPPRKALGGGCLWRDAAFGAHAPHLRWGPQRAPAFLCLRRGYVGAEPKRAQWASKRGGSPVKAGICKPWREAAGRLSPSKPAVCRAVPSRRRRRGRGRHRRSKASSLNCGWTAFLRKASPQTPHGKHILCLYFTTTISYSRLPSPIFSACSRHVLHSDSGAEFRK